MYSKDPYNVFEQISIEQRPVAKKGNVMNRCLLGDQVFDETEGCGHT